MMKTSITALLAFTGMLGDSNALKLSLTTQTADPAPVPEGAQPDTVPAGAVPSAGTNYVPPRSVLDELDHIFGIKHDAPDDSFGHPRMTYKRWATGMSNNGFEPENRGCVEIASWMAGDACVPCDRAEDWTCTTGAEPSFTNPRIVACDGRNEKATMCADPGFHRHFINVDED
jgi:hypothetical protein